MTPDNPALNDFETHLKALEDSVRKLESGDAPLEEVVREFEQGMQHAGACEELLKAAQLRVEQLLEPDPQAELQPFDEDGDDA